MKKNLLTIGILTLMLIGSHALAGIYALPAEPAAPALTDIPMSEAIFIAKNEVASRQGYGSGELENYEVHANYVRLENGENAWVVTFLANGIDNRLVSVTLMISPVNATIMDYQIHGGFGLFDNIRAQWEEVKGKYGAWPVEDQALFNLLYMGFDRYVVPLEGMLSQEEASAIALSALPQPPSSPEFYFLLDYNAAMPGTIHEYVWFVTIVVNGVEEFQINLSAIDGTVVEKFKLQGGVG